MSSLPFHRPGWRSPVPELGLVALVLLAYGDTLGFGYIWDDHLLTRLDLSAALERSFHGLHVRPVWYLSYVVSQRLAASPVVEHAVNLSLFALAAVLAYRLSVEMLGERAKAWIVTLVWLALPWNAYPVTWIAQRNDLLIFVFGFGAILALRRDRFALAWVLLALALFSKVTVAFVPLFFVGYAHRRGRRSATVAFSALFVVYLALALRAYLLYLEPASHLEQLGWVTRLLRFPFHWLEHLALLVVPVPFLLSVAHALLYFAGLAGVLLSSKPTTPAGESPVGRHDAWVLAGLASLVAAVTPELRICGFESLFWLIAITQLRGWRFKPPLALGLAALLAAYAMGIAATKPIFDTRLEPAPTDEPRGLYPTDYYQLRRAVLSEGWKSLAQR